MVRPKLALSLVLCAIGIFAGRAAYLRRVALPALSPAVYDREHRLLNVRLSQEGTWRLEADAKAILGEYANELVCLEDQRFHRHLGVDPLAVLRAVSQAMGAQRVISGASTIPMQLARLIHRWPRNFWAKIAEGIDAFLLSLVLSKDEILFAYAHRVPMGSNLEGVETAAQAYFGRPLAELSLRQRSILFLIPQRPNQVEKWNRERWLAASNAVLQRLSACGASAPESLAIAMSESLEIPVRMPLPRTVEHLADAFCADATRCLGLTTIDGAVQGGVQAMIRRRSDGFFAKGISNIAVGIVHNQSGEVRTLVGNFDYFSATRSQKIASFNVARSPGSTLKPLIFALALDDRLMLSESLLEDLPMRFGPYVPENFNAQFIGLVRAKTALSQSLNVPFIGLLAKLGVDRFLASLDAAGVMGRTPANALGLSLAVGGIEIQFLDMLRLYHGLASQGLSSHMHLFVNEKSSLERQPFISAAAAYLTTQAMRQRDRPEAERLSNLLGKWSPIAWKTGTSQNRLDAWSIGFDREHTVAVWLGNLDRQSSPHLVGAEAAAPLMFDIFSLLNAGRRPDFLPPPHTVSDTEVCALSGMIAGPACEHRVRVDAIEGEPPQSTCPYHQLALVDPVSGKAVAPHCLGGRPYQTRSVAVLPSRLKRWVGSDWHEFSTVEADPDLRCSPEQLQPRALTIQAPKSGTHFVIFEKQPEARLNIGFSARHSGPSASLQCFLNGDPMTLSTHDLLRLGLGKYRLVCSDHWGNSDSTQFRIVPPQFAVK